MTPETLWDRYGAIWTSDKETRTRELAECLSPQATYCDLNGLIEGQDALSEYMAQFQDGAPDTRFVVQSVIHHHDRALANWILIDKNGTTQEVGSTCALLDDEQRLLTISGFLYPTMDREKA